MRFGFSGGNDGGAGAGITRVADAAARLALGSPVDGFTVLQLDTDEIYAYNVGTASWRRLAGPQLAFTYTDTTSIAFTYNATTQDLQAALRLSAAAAGAGNYKVNFVVNADGLFAQIPHASAVNTGVLLSTDWAKFDSAVTTIGAFNGTANANGLTKTVNTLALHAADATNPGGVSTTTQTFAGAKTFASSLTASVDVRLADATAANPALVFTSEVTSGLYRIGAGELGLSILAAGVFAFRAGGLTIGSVAALADSEALAVNRAGAVKLGAATSAQVAAWTTVNPGAMVYNSTELQANVFVNSGWQHLGGKLRLVASDPLLLASLAEFNGNPFFRCMRRIAGNGGPVTASVSRTGCVDGMELYIVGTSDTNTVTLEPDANLAINGSITIGNGDTLQLVFDGAANIWREFGRSD